MADDPEVKEQEPERRFAGRELYSYEELDVEPFDHPENKAE